MSVAFFRDPQPVTHLKTEHHQTAAGTCGQLRILALFIVSRALGRYAVRPICIGTRLPIAPKRRAQSNVDG